MLTDQMALLAMPVQDGINRNRRGRGRSDGQLLLLLLLLLRVKEDEIILIDPIGMGGFETLGRAHPTHSPREGITFFRLNDMLEQGRAHCEGRTG
jgi:hypothetical protein